MANLPEKNVVLVDKITNVPTDSNLFINANGEFKQASVNDVVNSSTVVSTAVETAINTAVQDSIDSNFKQTSGSPILLTDSADGTLIDFRAYGRSTQSGTPTPDSPIAIDSVADGGYFDGELLGGYYDASGVFVAGANTTNVGSKNPIPCKGGDVIKIIYEDSISAITIALYDENMMFVDRQYKLNTNEFEITAPSNAKYMNFHLSAGYIITPQTTKKIVVTINDTYALQVKSCGKNLLENIAKTQTIKGVTFTVNDDGSVTVKGTLTEASAEIAISDYISLKNNTKYILSGCPDGGSEDKFYVRVWTNNAYKKLATDIGDGASFVTNFSEHINYKVYICVRGLGVSYDTTFYPMIRLAEITDDTYEPYTESVQYIQLSEPLRSSLDGSVTDEVSLTEVTRRFTEVVFDGSNDEDWNVISTNTNTNLFRIYPPTKAKVSPIICSHFVYYSGSNEDFEHTRLSAEANPVLAMWVNKTRIATVDEWKTWLQANPIKVQYISAEPIIEAIEPVDIVTYDNVTYLTASDNAEMELEYPTSKVAGIASIGYSKGRKAEYEVELLKAQLLELQTAMVNSL